MGLSESKRARKIIFVVGTLESGGIERSVTNWCLYLKKNTDWNPFVICILEKKGIFLNTLEEHGIKVGECKLRNSSFAPFTLRIAKMIRAWGGGVVHSQVAFSLLWQTMGFKLGGAKRIVFTQQNEYQNWSAFFPKLRLRIYYFLSRPLINHYTCVSEKVQENISALLGVPKNNFSVIYNSVNTEMFRPQPNLREEARRRIGVAQQEFCIGVVANASRQKGHEFILEACSVLKLNHTKPFKLVLIGNGDFESLKLLATQLNISDNTVFLGKRSDVDILLQGMDCFALPSRWEGLPLALIEAMATGLPAIASNVSGNAEVIEYGKTGILFPVGEINELAKGLTTLMEKPAYRNKLARDGQLMVAKRFGIQKSMDQYLSLYE